MANLERGRLDGVYGMRKFTAAELFDWANELEAQIKNPFNPDDPRYLQRWADKIRRLAIKKNRAKLHKEKQLAKH